MAHDSVVLVPVVPMGALVLESAVPVVPMGGPVE